MMRSQCFRKVAVAGAMTLLLAVGCAPPQKMHEDPFMDLLSL
jgi:hypothetical protein